VKLPPQGFRQLATFEERVRRLGDRLGPVRAVVQQARDEGFLAYVLGSLDPGLRYAFDFRHPSWDDPEIDPRLAEVGAVRVGALEPQAGFHYLRFRDPPYDDGAVGAIAEEIRPLLRRGAEVFAYFRHEDEPTAPAYAERLAALTR
jgi:uncharacterized protein YecE (DUF72 family)